MTGLLLAAALAWSAWVAWLLWIIADAKLELAAAKRRNAREEGGPGIWPL